MGVLKPAFGVLFALSSAGLSAAGEGSQPQDRRSEHTCKVLQIVDGSRLRVLWSDDETSAVVEKVHLIGIEAPLKGESGHAEAITFLKGLIGQGPVSLEFDGDSPERDKEGWILAYVRLKDGLDMNLEMTKQGYAVLRAGTDYGRREEYEAAFEAAAPLREKRRTEWAGGRTVKGAESPAAAPQDGSLAASGPLVAALRDPKLSSRLAAVRALSASKAPAAVPALVAAMRDQNPRFRQVVAEALGKIGDVAAFEALANTLGDEDPRCRRTAAIAIDEIRKAHGKKLQRFKYSDVVNSLIAALDDKERWCRLAAARALGEIQDTRALPSLMSAQTDRDPLCRKAAAEAVDKIQQARQREWESLETARELEPLLSALQDVDPRFRQAVAQALGRIADPRAVGPLIDGLKDPDAGFRKAAAEALGKIADPRAVEPLSASLNDWDRGCRDAAAEALGRIGDPRAVKPLIVALGDISGFDSANQALESIAGPAVEQLLLALTRPNPRLRKAAAITLGRIGDPRAVEPLVAALRDRDPDFRKAVALALGEMADPRADEALLATLKHEDLVVASGAYRYFIGRGEPGSEPVLVKALAKYGHATMARDFLNSGNDALEAAGRKWAENHGHAVITWFGSESRASKWGGGR